MKNEDNDEIIFTVADGTEYKMYHTQDCCEGVSIDNINGELSDLVGNPILLAETSSSSEHNVGTTSSESYDKKRKKEMTT